MRIDRLRERLDGLYAHYDHRFVDPDPLRFARAHRDPQDREVIDIGFRVALTLIRPGAGTPAK